MSNQVTTAFTKQFGSNITLLSQQKGAVLLPNVMNDTFVRGESVFMDQISATKAIRSTTRHADSPLVNTPHARRRINPVDVEWGDLVDDFDKLKMIIDPTSAMAQNAAWAIGREMDLILIESFFATAQTGKEGSGSTAFPAANVVAVNLSGTNEGLTIEKLRRARRLLLAGNVSKDDEMFIGVTAIQMDDLLATTEVTSADFNTVKALVQGDIDTFLGFKFLHTEQLEVDSNSFRRLPVWSRNGMGAAIAQNPTSRITERADKRFSNYVFYSTSMGASRLEEAKVIEIKCSE